MSAAASHASAVSRSGTLESAAVFPNWVILEPVVFRRDTESTFPDETKAPIRASGVTTWDGHRPFGFAFSLAEPPLISRLYAHLPDFPRKQFPLAILASHRNLALLRVGGYVRSSLVQDFFIFDASATDNHSSLTLLPTFTEPDMDYSRPDDSLPPRTASPHNKWPRLLTVKSMGLLCRGEHEFAVAQLDLCKLSRSKVFADIYLLLKLESDGPGSTGRWSSLCVPVLHSDNNYGYNSNDDLRQLCLWQTDAVIPVGRWLCWVDYYRGMLFCDVFGDPTPTVSFLRFPLDSFPDSYDRCGECSWLYRGVSAVDGDRALKFVDIARNDGIGYGALRPGAGYTITCHTLMLDSTMVWNKETLGGVLWSKNFTVTSADLWTANPRLPRHILMFPQVNMDRPHVVHFLATEFEYAMKKMWLVAIDMSTRTVESVSRYTNGLRDVGTEGEYLTHQRSICPMPFLASEFSKYLHLPRPRQDWFSLEDGIFYSKPDTPETWPFDSICSDLL